MEDINKRSSCSFRRERERSQVVQVKERERKRNESEENPVSVRHSSSLDPFTIMMQVQMRLFE